jgi:[ribosomal protein S18]-alanine N-acetyltransferase
MTLTIGEVASPDDLDAVMRIEQESFTNPWTREMYEAELGNRGVAHCWLARDEGQPVGFCSFWRILDELHINNLAVAPPRRREGIATTLLGHTLREGAKSGAKRATLEVRRSNTIAQRLYERHGFRIAAVRRGYYSNPVEDAIVLWTENLADG